MRNHDQVIAEQFGGASIWRVAGVTAQTRSTRRLI
jgi:hypothetical protein